MNKADKVKQKLIKEVVIPSLLGVLIALLFFIGCSEAYRSKRRQYPSNDRHSLFCFWTQCINSLSR